MLKEIKNYIKDHFKQLFLKTKKEPMCKQCKEKIFINGSRWKSRRWHCRKMWGKSICGDKTSFLALSLRYLIQKGIEKLKVAEDMEMIYRREKLFGRGNNSVYLADHQFILYKDDYGNFK